MSTFAKEFCENRLHLSKKQAFCIRFALFFASDLIRFSMIDQIIAYNKKTVSTSFPLSPLTTKMVGLLRCNIEGKDQLQ